MQTIAPPQNASKFSSSSQPRSSSQRAKAPNLTPLQRNNRKPLVVLSSKPAFPLWLKVLIGLKEGVALTLLLSVVGVLGTYKWVADVQHQWGENYHELRQLERKERQLMGANENLRSHFAATNQAHSDLVPIDPTKALFIKPSPARPKAWVDTQSIKILSLPASY